MDGISRLGYLGIEVSDIGAWRDFAADVVGMQAVEHDRGALCLRLDERALRILLQPGASDDLAFVGWEVDGGEGLEALARRLETAGMDIRWGSDEEARHRRVRQYFRFPDPEGITTEVFSGAEAAGTPFHSPCGISGFLTGDDGVGRLAVTARHPERQERFYVEQLGFRVTDYVSEPGNDAAPDAYLRVNDRHSAIAICRASSSPKRLARLTVEFATMDDLGHSYDRAKGRNARITATLGRNTNDRMCSFHVASPSGFPVEIGHGALRMKEGAVPAPVTHERTSIWGHRPPERSEIGQGWERAKKKARQTVPAETTGGS